MSAPSSTLLSRKHFPIVTAVTGRLPRPSFLWLQQLSGVNLSTSPFNFFPQLLSDERFSSIEYAFPLHNGSKSCFVCGLPLYTPPRLVILFLVFFLVSCIFFGLFFFLLLFFFFFFFSAQSRTVFKKSPVLGAELSCPQLGLRPAISLALTFWVFPRHFPTHLGGSGSFQVLQNLM